MYLSHTTQQFVDAGFGAGLRIDFFHNHGALEAVAAVFGRQAA